jgi:hypothetical protein
MTIPESSAETKASLLAAILLWALEIIRGFGCSWPNTATEAIALVDAGRSQAYEILGRLKELSGTLYGQSGRPEAKPAPAAAMAVCQAVRDYLLTHPGAARAGDARSRYGDAFRRFVLDLGGPGGIGHALPREQFADAVGVPVGTLDGWLHEPPPAIAEEDPPQPDVPTLTTYAWARNGKPRKRLDGRSPRDVYRDDRPTPEQIQEGKDCILELRRRQERIRRTREARLDPAILALLAAGLPELDIADTDGRIASSLAGYSRDAIVYGLAAFAAKRDLDAVPADAEPHRYLGGIIRNCHIHLELEYTSRHLLEQRLRLADLALKPLVQKADRIRETRPAIEVPRECVDQALQAETLIDFRFRTRAARRRP